ncbi:serine hydrolase domain-containing protein [Pseudoxanthomonas dokdonensis]|nr:serine hydrolase domain-containing protein [Pseudoxanthomonas dokdonensis]
MFKYRYLLWLALAPCPVQAVPPSPENPLQVLVTDNDQAIAPGCALGVFRQGQADQIAAAGYADIARRQPIDGDTLFYAASVSKQFTALAVAQLASQGQLSLDDEVQRYLPELPRYDAPVTLDMLLHHSSGVRDFLSLLRMAGLGSGADNSRDTALALLMRQRGTNFVPGTDYLYSNGGYLLLAEVVARVSGMSFADYVNTRVLAPMGMTRSYVMQGRQADVQNLAHGYVEQDGEFAVRDSYPHFGGSGGLMTSINDLARYQRDMTLQHRVWTDDVRRIMLTPGRLSDGRPVIHPSDQLAYAGGLLVGQRNGQRVVQHSGSAEAFKAFYAYLPDAGVSAAILCNRADWNAGRKIDAALARILPDGFAAPAPPPLAGRYGSDELQADYQLSLQGEVLTVVVQSRLPGTAPVTFLLQKDQQQYQGKSFSLTPADDHRSFVLDSDRSRGIRVDRTEADSRR